MNLEIFHVRLVMSSFGPDPDAQTSQRCIKRLRASLCDTKRSLVGSGEDTVQSLISDKLGMTRGTLLEETLK